MCFRWNTCRLFDVWVPVRKGLATLRLGTKDKRNLVMQESERL